MVIGWGASFLVLRPTGPSGHIRYYVDMSNSHIHPGGESLRCRTPALRFLTPHLVL